MNESRDMTANPYSADERRVAEWLAAKTGIGAGTDPIGFMIASHEHLNHQLQLAKRQITELMTTIERLLVISDG